MQVSGFRLDLKGGKVANLLVMVKQVIVSFLRIMVVINFEE